MLDEDILVKRIKKLPPYLIEKVENYVDFIEYNQFKQVEEITLASEESLSKDWLKSEEEEAWADL